MRKGLGGAAPRFELFYLGTPPIQQWPSSRRCRVPNGGRGTTRLRPQYYKRSPFRTTLNMDGDAVPCGARLVEAFRAFAESKAAVAGLWHVGVVLGPQHGVHGVGQRESGPAPRGLGGRCATRHLANRTIRHDQPRPLAGAERDERRVRPALLGGERLHRVCRADKEGHCASTCAADGGEVDHRDWGPNYNKAGIDGIAKVDGGTKA